MSATTPPPDWRHLLGEEAWDAGLYEMNRVDIQVLRDHEMPASPGELLITALAEFVRAGVLHIEYREGEIDETDGTIYSVPKQRIVGVWTQTPPRP